MIMYTCSAMTHIFEDVRNDAVKTMDLWVKVAPDIIKSKFWDKVEWLLLCQFDIVLICDLDRWYLFKFIDDRFKRSEYIKIKWTYVEDSQQVWRIYNESHDRKIAFTFTQGVYCFLLIMLRRRLINVIDSTGPVDKFVQFLGNRINNFEAGSVINRKWFHVASVLLMFPVRMWFLLDSLKNQNAKKAYKERLRRYYKDETAKTVSWNPEDPVSCKPRIVSIE